METTFITIHNLSPDANILYASESIEDILGFQPADVIGRSCFDYFHPEQIPFARKVHSLSVQMDKAASLHYAGIKNQDGQYIDCECVFTIVYDVLIACTSIYRRTAKNRYKIAPVIRRLFASTPRDPRYHMLEHLSAKFKAPAQASFLEPRAALFLNRFTEQLDIMYATPSVESILGLKAGQLRDKSFYECIAVACRTDAVHAMQSAKGNDSIAYLRFTYNDPRTPEDLDEEMHDASASSDSDDGGVQLTSHPMELDTRDSPSSSRSGDPENGGVSTMRPRPIQHMSSTTTGAISDLEHDSAHIFDRPPLSRSSTSTSSERLEGSILDGPSGRRRVRRAVSTAVPIELEAVVSCTSDGLVVVLRKARPAMPTLFAAPWGVNPIRPHVHQFNPQYNFQHGLHVPYQPMDGPSTEDFMVSIRDVAVFAWSLTGINGNIAAYAHGTPRGQAFPPGGLPIWDPHAQPTPDYMPPENQAVPKWTRWAEKTNEPYANRANVVPYRHFRQEELLRHQTAQGTGPMSHQNDHGIGSMNSQFTFTHSALPREQQPNIAPGPPLQGQQNYIQGPRGQNKRAHEQNMQRQQVQGYYDYDDDDDREGQRHNENPARRF